MPWSARRVKRLLPLAVTVLIATAALSALLLDPLQGLRELAGRVVALGDAPAPPHDIPSCVQRSLSDLRRCAFTRREGLARPRVDRQAVRRADGVRLIDPTSRSCPHRLCPAVIGDVIVYRNAGHLTATYARTLSWWLARRLPKRLPEGAR